MTVYWEFSFLMGIVISDMARPDHTRIDFFFDPALKYLDNR